MTYQARHADLQERSLPPALTRLWAENLSMSGDLDARLRWAYEENPEGHGEVFVLEWIPQRDSIRAIGCVGLVRRAFACRGEMVDAAMFGQFAVDAEHRLAGPAVLLQREAGSFVKANFRFGYGFPADSATGVLRRVGHRDVGKVVRYARALDYGYYLRNAGQIHLRWSAWAGPAMSALANAPAALRVRRRERAFEFCWLDRADERFDDLWNEACRRYPLLGDRRQLALNWRFARMPGGSCRFATLVDRSSRVRAYAVVDGAPGGVSEIKDFLARDEDDLLALLDRLALELAKEGQKSMSVRFLGPGGTVRALEAAGFHERDGKRNFMVGPCDAGGPGEISLDPECWYLTDGDEDW